MQQCIKFIYFRMTPLASIQQYLFDRCLLLYVQSCTPDDGQKRPSETCRVSF